MPEIEAKPRKWGNSIGIVIPKEVVDEQHITLKDSLVVEIRKKKSKKEIKELFGKFSFDKSTQRIKEEMRKGWE